MSWMSNRAAFNRFVDTARRSTASTQAWRHTVKSANFFKLVSIVKALMVSAALELASNTVKTALAISRNWLILIMEFYVTDEVNEAYFFLYVGPKMVGGHA